MSTANAKNGSAIESRAAQESTARAQAPRPALGIYQEQDNFLAQIPDLDPKSTPRVLEKLADGRIINQALSIKLVLGVGLALVMVAILPFVFGKVARPGPAVKELPAWSNSGGSTGVSGNTSQTVAPTWPPSPTAPITTAVSPQNGSAPAPAILMPQPPQFGDTRPTALTEPSWSLPRPPASPAPAAAPSPTPNYDFHPPVTNTYRPDNRADYRGFYRDPQADPRLASGYPEYPARHAAAPDARNWQADNRNDVAAQFRNNDTRYDYRGNTIDPPPVRRDVPAGGYAPDTRYDNAGGIYPPAAGPGSPLMPSGTPGPTSYYRDPQISEPGVARFDGTITPPARTNYDRTGSSTN